MSKWTESREAARKAAAYKPDLKNRPSLTDQAGAGETDINIIVKKFAVTGRVPAKAGEPLTGDFTLIPTDLRTRLKPAEYVLENLGKLPKAMQKRITSYTPAQLRDMNTDELIAAIMPAPENKPPADKPKEGEPK